jgi:hypothetical protein
MIPSKVINIKSISVLFFNVFAFANFRPASALPIHVFLANGIDPLRPEHCNSTLLRCKAGATAPRLITSSQSLPANSMSLRINTCKNLSKQTALTPSQSTLTGNPGGGVLRLTNLIGRATRRRQSPHTTTRCNRRSALGKLNTGQRRSGFAESEPREQCQKGEEGADGVQQGIVG